MQFAGHTVPDHGQDVENTLESESGGENLEGGKVALAVSKSSSGQDLLGSGNSEFPLRTKTC